MQKPITGGNVEIKGTIEGALDTAGAWFPLDLPTVCTFAGPGGALDTITVGPDVAGITRRKTLTYTGTDVTNPGQWVQI